MAAGRVRTLRILLVGDPGVGKQEFLQSLPAKESALPGSPDGPREVRILRDGKPVDLRVWHVPPGLFYNYFMTNGCSGVIFFFDITKKKTFTDVRRWIEYADANTPYPAPRILIGNRLHLEFDRQVSRKEAQKFASKMNMRYYEVSTLAFFNVEESLAEVARLAIKRFEDFYGAMVVKKNVMPTLREICAKEIGRNLRNVHFASTLPLPAPLQTEIRSYVIGKGSCTCEPLAPSRPRRKKLLNSCSIL